MLNDKILENKIKSLLWNIAKQREKVSGNLITLLPLLYPDASEETLHEMRIEIMKNITY